MRFLFGVIKNVLELDSGAGFTYTIVLTILETTEFTLMGKFYCM